MNHTCIMEGKKGSDFKDINGQIRASLIRLNQQKTCSNRVDISLYPEGQFTPSERENESEKDKRLSAIDQTKIFKHQRKLSLSPLLSVGIKGP